VVRYGTNLSPFPQVSKDPEMETREPGGHRRTSTSSLLNLPKDSQLPE